MPEVVANTVDLCLFRFNKDEPEYLLLRRSARERYPGLWQIITGTIHQGEKGPDAMLRELKEETGLRPLRFWVVPTINGFYDQASDSISLVTSFAGQVAPDGNPVLSEEHDQFAWLPYSAALRRLVWPGQKGVLGMVDRFILRGEPAGEWTQISPETIP